MTLFLLPVIGEIAFTILGIFLCKVAVKDPYTVLYSTMYAYAYYMYVNMQSHESIWKTFWMYFSLTKAYTWWCLLVIKKEVINDLVFMVYSFLMQKPSVYYKETMRTTGHGMVIMGYL